MAELGILKLRLESAIDGYKIALHAFPGDKDTKHMLHLLEDCYSVISRIIIVKT